MIVFTHFSLRVVPSIVLQIVPVAAKVSGDAAFRVVVMSLDIAFALANLVSFTREAAGIKM